MHAAAHEPTARSGVEEFFETLERDISFGRGGRSGPLSGALRADLVPSILQHRCVVRLGQFLGPYGEPCSAPGFVRDTEANSSVAVLVR